MSRKYKLVRITPEEYLTIGEAGGWVLAWPSPWESPCDVDPETRWSDWRGWSDKYEYLYTRIEE